MEPEPLDSVARDLHPKFTDAVQDPDLFRAIIRAWGVLEDVLERHIAAALSEPLQGLDSTPFRHKLGLAIALGLIDPGAKRGLQDLATLRHKLAHADRDIDSIGEAEALAIVELFGEGADSPVPLRQPASRSRQDHLMRLALILAFVEVEARGLIARDRRLQERAALEEKLRGQAARRSIVDALLAEEPESARPKPSGGAVDPYTT